MSRRLGKKELNAELNITPLVDLFSTIVCFLLIAAVWVQVNALDVKQSYGTEGAKSKEESYELNLKYESDKKILAVFKKGRKKSTLKVEGQDFDDLLVNLNQKLQDWMAKNEKSKVASTFIMPKKIIDYGQLVSTMDVLRQNKLSNIGIMKIGDR